MAVVRTGARSEEVSGPRAGPAVESPPAQGTVEDALEVPESGWTTDEVARLHFILLDDLGRLADPRTPLEEKFELLEWVFTDPEKEAKPFSFRACMRLYQRTCDPETARAMLRELVGEWLKESLAALPAWPAERILREPQWAASQLHRNPQWINEELRRRGREPDLFSKP